MKGLSSDTLGRLNEGTPPRRCSVASIVAPFIVPPLSVCRTQPRRSKPAQALVSRTGWTLQKQYVRRFARREANALRRVARRAGIASPRLIVGSSSLTAATRIDSGDLRGYVYV